MTIEWAWIGPQRSVEIRDRGIFLHAEGDCVVMLLHGLTGSPAELGYLAYRLQRRGGYSVQCPRLVNHGQPLGVLSRTTWTQLYESAKHAFFEARSAARAKGVPVVVGGLSLGAILSLMLAAEFPEDVAGVICLSPTLFYDGWNVPWYHRLIPLVDYTPLKYFTYFREDEPYGIRDESLREQVAAQFHKMSLRDSASSASLGYAHFPVRLFCEMQHLIKRCKKMLPAVICPVLLIQAEEDDMTSPRNSEYIRDKVGSSRCNLVLLKRSYHVVSADLERSTVADHLERFLESVIGSRSEAPEAAELDA